MTPKNPLANPPAARPRAFSYLRMSTPEQIKGDSLRRQLEASAAYAAAHGLELVEEDRLQDIGISAFRGANAADGVLGWFLEVAKAGKIPGSFLLVESLDRLSRQEPRKSLRIFLDIIDAGINIVTLMDNHVYNAEKIDRPDGVMELFGSIMIMARANEESNTKRDRVTNAWANKRRNTTLRKLTSICPGWLKLSNDKKSFAVIPDRVKIVRSIFEDSAAGIGMYSITRRLNQKKISPFGNGEGWQKGAVAKVLTNRAVLGEFQPHRMLNGKRVPDGEVIKDYFPAVINEDLFYRAQGARFQRRSHSAGRKGNNIANLFSGLARCAYCNGVMRYENKGSGPKDRGTYLVCDRARRGLGCEKTAWRYNEFEASFLAFVSELDLDNIIRDDKNFINLENEIAALHGKLAGILEQQERTYELFAKAGKAADFVGKKLNDLAAQQEQLDTSIRQKEKESIALKSELAEFHRGKDQIKSLIEQINGKDSYVLRAQIAARIKSLISSLIIAPAGYRPTKKTDADVINPLIDKLPDEYKIRQRYFCVGFKDGIVQGVFPSDEDPLDFEQVIIR
jgi:DNA invertase Pin-like site-specific DNA recombinase